MTLPRNLPDIEGAPSWGAVGFESMAMLRRLANNSAFDEVAFITTMLAK
jgi:hypothetical protein